MIEKVYKKDDGSLDWIKVVLLVMAGTGAGFGGNELTKSPPCNCAAFKSQIINLRGDMERLENKLDRLILRGNGYGSS